MSLIRTCLSLWRGEWYTGLYNIHFLLRFCRFSEIIIQSSRSGFQQATQKSGPKTKLENVTKAVKDLIFYYGSERRKKMAKKRGTRQCHKTLKRAHDEIWRQTSLIQHFYKRRNASYYLVSALHTFTPKKEFPST